MIITTILENESISKDLKAKHGLSLHIEANGLKLLFDLGKDGTFIENAKKLGINIEDVDILVISHGHKDHGGGLEEFLKFNKKAKIYINEEAFNRFYASVFKVLKVNIGLDAKLKEEERIILTKDYFDINDGMVLFSKVEAKEFLPEGNRHLLVKKNNKYLLDDFSHEQNLVIKEGSKRVLICGCSHRGVLNIINKSEELIGDKIDAVIGGFHLYNPLSKKTESKDLIDSLANRLSAKDSSFYTCHCTGSKAFEMLRETLEERVKKLSTGSIITI